MLKTKALLSKITPQYIIDKAGKKTGVILDIAEFTKTYTISRARPELVEGYPRALGDILQQVQDERDKIF